MSNRIYVIQERCTGCTACSKVCPVTCIDMVGRPAEDKAAGVKWPKLAVIEEDKCIFCGACVDTCNTLGEKSKKTDVFHAIVMEKDTVSPTTPILDPTLFKGVWVYAEVRHGKMMSTAFELLHVGRKLAGDLQEDLSAVIIGHNLGNALQELIEHGADKVYVFDDPM